MPAMLSLDFVSVQYSVQTNQLTWSGGSVKRISQVMAPDISYQTRWNSTANASDPLAEWILSGKRVPSKYYKFRHNMTQ